MTKRKPLKTKKTPRKPNPYNVIRRVVSKYCKEQGTKCGNDELNEIYREHSWQDIVIADKKNLWGGGSLDVE